MPKINWWFYLKMRNLIFAVIFLRLRETHKASQLPVFFLFFCRPYPVRRNCKSVFLILQISQYGGSRRWVHLFQIYPCKNWYKNWYLHFYKTNDHQICQAGTSTEFDSNKTNQVGAGDVYVKNTWQTKTSPLWKLPWPPNIAWS